MSSIDVELAQIGDAGTLSELSGNGLTTAAQRNGHGDARPRQPLQRLALLCDEGSLSLLRSEVLSGAMGEQARPGDGVVGATGRIGGRRVFCYAQDARFAGGSVGHAHADTIVRVQRLAGQARVPLISMIESGGARMQEGLAGLDGYARIFSEHVSMSGGVPQLSVITGTSAGGGSYSPALTDFVIMTRAASLFLTGPGIVQEVTGETISASELGGADVHESNGVSHFTVPTDLDAVFLVRQLLGYLPQNASQAPPARPAAAPAGPDPGTVVPFDGRRGYDVRNVALGIVDADSLLEVSPAWAPNIVTALARLEGQPLGIVANQPRHLGGVIDADAAQKAARFVRTCNAFNLPLVVLVDTPGFLPGSEQERTGVIRHGAKLLHAFAEATVPRATVVLRKAFGGAYITMNSRNLGADLTLAWRGAELGIMGPEQAVGIIHRRSLAVAANPADTRRRLADDYAAHHLSALRAAQQGHIDDVISPDQTRSRLTWAISDLPTYNPDTRRIRNIPL